MDIVIGTKVTKTVTIELTEYEAWCLADDLSSVENSDLLMFDSTQRILDVLKTKDLQG